LLVLLLQVRIREAEKFMSAADIARRGAAESAADKAYQEQMLDSAKNKPRGPHPMLRQVRLPEQAAFAGLIGSCKHGAACRAPGVTILHKLRGLLGFGPPVLVCLLFVFLREVVCVVGG
jgi:hypothetical protein